MKRFLLAYLIGLALARQFLRNRVLAHRMCAIAFSLLTPFYFLKAGSYVSARAIVEGALLIAALFLIKMVAKGIGIMNLASSGLGEPSHAYVAKLRSSAELRAVTPYLKEAYRLAQSEHRRKGCAFSSEPFA